MRDRWPGPPCQPLRREENKIIKFVPFNPTDKYTIAFVSENATGKIQRVMKGAPQVT